MMMTKLYIVIRNAKEVRNIGKKIDTRKPKAEFLAKEVSLNDISKKYNISYSTLRKIAMREQWSEQREQVKRRVGTKINEKIIERKAERIANDIVSIEYAANEILKQATEALTQTKRREIEVKTRAKYHSKDSKGKPIEVIKEDIEFKYAEVSDIDVDTLRKLSSTLAEIADIQEKLKTDKDKDIFVKVVNDLEND